MNSSQIQDITSGSGCQRQDLMDVSSPAFTGAEKLVGIGFRCWLAGYDTGDIACWETCWKQYLEQLGAAQAKSAVTELSYWVRTVKDQACRDLNYYPFGCSRFCPDECLAISLVAACQHKNCPALSACASALIGSNDVEPVLRATEGFAHVLAGMNQTLALGPVQAIDQGSCPHSSS